MKQQIKSEGIILKRLALNEADQIVTLFSPDLGKVSCLAKGARRMKSKFCGSLELLSQVSFSGFQGRDLLYLDEAGVLKPRPLFDLNLKSKGLLFYIAEITTKLIPEGQENEVVYCLLGDTLDHLSRSPERGEIIFDAYLVKLLTELGFMAHWNHCARSGEKLNLNYPLFMDAQEISVISNGYQSSGDPRLTPSLIKWVNFIQKNEIGKLIRICPSPGEKAQLSYLIQAAFQNLFSYPLKSEMFMNLVK